MLNLSCVTAKNELTNAKNELTKQIRYIKLQASQKNLTTVFDLWLQALNHKNEGGTA